MSEIKFRAWDKDRKEYLSAGQILIAIEPGVRPIKNSVYLDILKNADSYRNRFDIEQYTGLKDKNDVEIYEGDIIAVDNGIGYVAVVYFSDGAFKRVPVGQGEASAELLIGYPYESKDYEVIGNIHEQEGK